MIKLTPEQFKEKYGTSGFDAFGQNQAPQRAPNYLQRVASGFNDAASDIKSGITKGADDIVAGNPLGGTRAGLRTVGAVAKAAFTPVVEAPVVKQTLDFVGNGIAKVPGVSEAATRLKAFSEKHPEIAKDVEDIINIATLGAGKAVEKPLSVAGTKAITVPAKAAKESLNKTTTGALDTIENLTKRITEPEISQAAKVSLNPQAALKGTGQDITVKVGGKSKKLSEITPTENMKLKISTEKALNGYTKQAELFKNDRSIKGGSPVEIVGSRTDSAVDFANRIRQNIGSRMGEIESKYVSDQLPIGDKTLNLFTETLKSIDNPKYGVSKADAPIVQKLISDFDALESSGSTIGERLDFIRSWTQHLEDSKDSFGKFKENATVNTRIQNAIKALREETVNAISKKDKTYRTLRSKYSEHKKLQEIADQLLGKDGLLGERIKGAATVKRAIQSNSDAGARQFLTKLREITGYDAIRDGDIALTAMKNVGDYQGLSLLNILDEGKSGVVKRVLGKLQDKVVGDEATRVKRYIRK